MVNGLGSLARLSPDRAPGAPGTLLARSTLGNLRVPPRPERIIRFGRNAPEFDTEVHLAVGVDDARVSRRHGELTFRGGNWWLRNTGQQLVRLPGGQRMHASTEPIPLASGYTPVFVQGTGYREHLVELFVTGHETRRTAPPPGSATLPPERWPLSDDERLLLVTLGQDYLRYTADPRPWPYSQASRLLAVLRPGEIWSERRIEGRVATVRKRLHESGRFPYKVMLGEHDPCDNNLLHNLLTGLVESTTLVPPDLDLLD
jgi:hypothetical protein